MRRPRPFPKSVSSPLLIALALAGLAGGCALARKTAPRVPATLEDMVFVPAGEFLMGSEGEGAADDERPVRRVWVDAFYIDRTEVTNAAFKAFADSTRRLYPNNPMWDEEYFLNNPDHPVINITFQQAQAYCDWKNKRLPTEAEWEKAARGTDGQVYPWGNAWDETRMNFWGDSHGPDVFYNTAPVGSFPAGASPYGALDMIGNVWEWCSDWFDEHYYSKGFDRNPRGPEEPTPWRVVRGGGFSSPRRPIGDSTVANRSKNHPSLPIHHVGCRCAWSPED